MATISQALALATQHHQAGQPQLAEQICRNILAVEPNHAEALNLLGVIAERAGQYGAAVEHIGRAIELRGTDAAFRHNLGLAFQRQGKLGDAIACYRRALELSPSYADAQHNLGTVLQGQGKLDEAVACYRKTLELKPEHAKAHYNLGAVAQAFGKLGEAVACYRRALQLEPNYAEASISLGSALREQGKLDDAIACYRRALELRPDHAGAYNNLGIALKDQGKLDEAAACYRRALELWPGYAGAGNNLGAVLGEQGKLDEAVAAYRRVLELQPDHAEAHNNLGTVLQKQARFDEAIPSYRRALELRPGYAEAHGNLGAALNEQGKLDGAACLRRALELRPGFAEAQTNLGAVLEKQGKLDEAVACHRRALELRPGFAEAHNNLGSVLTKQGELDKAVACYRRAVELKPGDVGAHSNLVYVLNFCSGYDAKTIYEEHRRWNQRHAEPLRRFVQPHRNDRSPLRRLRLGYVSPDFWWHSVGRFFLPLLEAHNHSDFEIFCYASRRASDWITERCRASADVWRDAVALSDEQLADVVRHDQIDILVDLTMHMENNRLLVFARKPAPVQVTYLAYCGTTGLTTIDYRFTDRYLDPPEQAERFYSEESVRLPETYWCYRPIAGMPGVCDLPALSGGGPTFGCLNNFCKVTLPTLAAWSRLLQVVPKSQLLLSAQPGSHRDRVRRFFAQQGVAPERVGFAGLLPIAEYHRAYGGVDVALDPFPYGGGTTTCDALWMGVPVVSLAGQTAVGRGGLSILSNLGLTDLVAHDCDEYVRIAADLARDLPRLGELRATTRDRMQKSPLMDAPRFARNVEAAYRMMWRRWCERS